VSVLAGALALGAAVGASAGLAGCGSDPPAGAPATAPAGASASGAVDAHAQLAARAAAAKDRRYAAVYRLDSGDQPGRMVVVTRAATGDWRVDIERGALGGTADVSVARTPEGLFQCALPSAERLIAPVCVRVAGRDGQPAAAVDPRVQHVFVDWLEVFTDRGAAIAVAPAKRPRGVAGRCFSVESNSASLDAPLDVGVYCYADNGTLTGARLAYGTLTLTEEPGAAPPAITLPGPVVDGEPLPMASPPPPPTTAPAEVPTPET
jgi:hypothetical protein